jgi:pyridoxal phosphate enzyme (YggS family)
VTSIADGIQAVRERIGHAAEASGRSREEVKLIVVSKAKTAEAIREAHEAGQRAFGESYAQEIEVKARLLGDLPDIEWHFIGHLQSNKAKTVAPLAHMVHTVDTPSLARELARRVVKANRRALQVVIEVNVAHEPQKHGVSPGDLEELMQAVQAEPALDLRGLMTVPPADDLSMTRRVFETLATLRSLHGGVLRLPELSMGMSHDLEVAVACGATLVRVGTAVFGPR